MAIRIPDFQADSNKKYSGLYVYVDVMKCKIQIAYSCQDPGGEPAAQLRLLKGQVTQNYSFFFFFWFRATEIQATSRVKAASRVSSQML